MREFLTRLTTLRAAYPDSAERQQAQRLLIINLAWIAIIILAAPFMLWWLANVPDFNVGILFVPLTVIVSIAIHVLIQRGQIRQSRRLFVLNLLITALLTIFPEYRLDSPFIITLVLPLTAAGVLLRGSRQLWIALSLSTVVSIIGLAQIAADMEPTRLGSATQSIGTSIILALIIISLNTLMLWLFSTSTEEVLDRQHYLTTLITNTAQITQTLSALPAMGEELNQVVEQLRDMLGLYHVQIFLADAASGLPVLQAGTGFIGRRLLEEGGLASPSEASPISAALRKKDPIMIRHTDAEDQRSSFLPATQSELLLPLRVGNLVPFGVLDLHSTRPDAFPPEERDLLLVISSHIAAALHTLRQTETLSDSFEQRDKLSDQVEAAQRDVARLNRQLVGSTWGIYLKERQHAMPGLDWQTGALTPTSSTQPDESGLLAQTIRDGEAHLEQRDDGSVLCVPIQLRGQTLGAVEFRRTAPAQWTTAALDMARVVAERLALSLENARLFEQAQTTAQREQLVSQITSQLQATTDLQSLLTLAAARFQEALGATHTRVRLGIPEDET